MDTEAYKILIVDDLPKNIMVLGNNLMNENYHIAYARNGSEAIKLTKSNSFDLILLDIMMPGMDGYDTCREILADPKTSNIPIIFITAKNDHDSVVKGFKAGAKDYVTKPFNSSELLARVKTHLELKRSRERLESLNANLEKKVEERTLELQKANEKLKKLDLAKSGFLGIISHEIRTPLNGIFGSIEMLSDIHSQDEETLEIVQMMSESAERLLTFSELSTLITELNIDHYRLSKGNVDLVEMVNLVKQEKEINDDERIEFDIDFKQFKEKHIVQADIKLLKKIISDVMDNSIRFADKKVVVQVQINKNDEEVELIINDNGIGFPEGVLPNVFDVFQADSKNYVDGKGLNLAAARLIMEAHDGRITASNLSEGGASVRISFPLK